MNYTEFCMKQIEFWEQKLFESMAIPDKLQSEIDSVLKTRNTERLKDLYKHLKELREQGELTEEKYRDYLKYISTSRVA